MITWHDSPTAQQFKKRKAIRIEELEPPSSLPALQKEELEQEQDYKRKFGGPWQDRTLPV